MHKACTFGFKANESDTWVSVTFTMSYDFIINAYSDWMPVDFLRLSFSFPISDQNTRH